MKISFIPSEDNFFNIESDIDFGAILQRCDSLMDLGDVSGACQLRLDTAIEAIEALDMVSDDDIELNMNNRHNQLFVEIICTCGLDHFYICDFETAAAMFETTLELDSEDHFGALAPLAYCYAALGEYDALEDITPLLQFSRHEQEFFDAFLSFVQKRSLSISPALKIEISRQDSCLAPRIKHLMINFPEFEKAFI